MTGLASNEALVHLLDSNCLVSPSPCPTCTESDNPQYKLLLIFEVLGNWSRSVSISRHDVKGNAMAAPIHIDFSERDLSMFMLVNK